MSLDAVSHLQSSAGQGKTRRCLQDWQRSDDRHIERWEFLRRRFACRLIYSWRICWRYIRYEWDLVDQLFDSSEKRLARVLLVLLILAEGGC